ncbi:MAG TPA: hypothetical protein VHQ20_01575, partial [Patescibacteria group bacterium]|nr:hypothetical protein [Patescibacteria group bacterium]
MRRIIPFSLYIPPDFKIVMGVLVASMCGLIVLALVASYFQSHNTQPQTKPGKFNLKIDLNSLIFGPTPAKLDDSPSKCMTIKECMDGGEAHQAYVGR